MTGTARAPIPAAAMTVLYDDQCPVCRQARRWVERERQLVPVRFVAAGSPAAIGRFPRLDVTSTLADVTVVTDGGAVLRGERAWIAVLWALSRTRSLAVALAAGRRRWALRPLTGAAETIRRLSSGQTPEAPAAGPGGWPPPSDRAGRNCPT